MCDEKIYRYSCDCGCGDGFELRNAFGRLYVHFFRGDWYAEQHPGRHGLVDRVKYVGGKRCVREVILTRDALREIKAFLLNVSLDADWKPSGPAYSRLSFDVDVFDEGDRLYHAYLDGRMPAGGVLFGWYHRMFELDIGPCMVGRLVGQIDKCLMA